MRVDELTGRMLAEETKLRSSIVLRMGNFAPEPIGDIAMRALDRGRLMRRCVEAKSSGLRVVSELPAQWSDPYDSTRARSLLSWVSRQIPLEAQ